MQEKTLFFNDMMRAFFSPRLFFQQRFLELSGKRIHSIGFIGIFVGILLGSLITYGISLFVGNDFSARPEVYQSALENIGGLSREEFLQIVKLQRAYSLLMAILSPFIAFMAHHLYGGALFIFLWILAKNREQNLELSRVMECASAALASMIFYAIPLIGPFVAVVMVVINTSRALFINYKMLGFMKSMSILMAVYICFFLSTASLQIVADQLAKNFNF